MKQEELVLSSALGHMQELLFGYFTIPKLKDDFFGSEEKVECSAFDSEANYFDIELEKSDRLLIISSRVIAYGPDVSLIILEVGIGNVNDSLGRNSTFNYYGNFRYNHEFELTEVEWRNFY